MPSYSLKQVLAFIKQGQTFQGQVNETGCYIKVDAYLPVVCTAIHAGHQLRDDLSSLALLDPQQRFHYEDAFIGDMISAQPITLCAEDSRFEYDLNQPRALASYFKPSAHSKIWRKSLSQKQRNLSQQKHADFYQIYNALVSKLEKQFGKVIIFDLRGFNKSEQSSDAPVFKLTNAQINTQRWGAVTEQFCKELNKMTLPNIDMRAAIDNDKEHDNYLVTHTNSYFDNTLVVPTELKKVYLDTQSGQSYPLVMDALKLGLKNAISQTAAYFERKYNRRRVRHSDMLSSAIDPSILKIDKALYQVSSRASILKYVNPTNLLAEQRRFFQNPMRFVPRFRYRQLPVDSKDYKYQLYKLPIESIDDPAIKQLYSDTVHKLSQKIDMLSTVGTEDFLYNALNYFGRPGEVDKRNAEFLLYAKLIEEESGELLDADTALARMAAQAKAWNMKCKVTFNNRLAAKAQVTSQPPQLQLNGSASYYESEVQRLIHHELGVHMATTLASREQPLKILRVGLPGSTFTQEGLAIMAEYQNGYLSHGRLRTLAARVLAVDSMLTEQNFYQTYSYLMDELKLEKQEAFTISMRVYRGGGFTKDALYLKGFMQVLQCANERSIDNLMIGKTSLDYLDLLDELVGRGWLKAGTFFADTQSPQLSPQLQYLLSSLR